jgi:hypothetical protein
MLDIKIDPPEEYTEAQSFFKRHIIPVVVIAFAVIAAIILSLVSVFYPQNYSDDLVQPDSSIQR